MTPEQEAMLRETVARIVKGEAKLIERMLALRAQKWTNFVLSELAAAAEVPVATEGLTEDEASALAYLEKMVATNDVGCYESAIATVAAALRKRTP